MREKTEIKKDQLDRNRLHEKLTNRHKNLSGHLFKENFKVMQLKVKLLK